MILALVIRYLRSRKPHVAVCARIAGRQIVDYGWPD